MSDYNPLDPDESIIRKQVDSITFSYYTDNDVRQRSIIQIASPISFDPNGNPLLTGLYDPRMGPYRDSDKSPCPTCASNRVTNCPGHYGHIELFVPIYHPMRFMELVSILRCKCYHCHTLQGPKRTLDIIKCKLLLLLSNQYNIVNEVDRAIRMAVFNNNASTFSSSSGAFADYNTIEEHDDGGNGGETKTNRGNVGNDRTSKAAMTRANGIVIDRTLQDIYERFIQPNKHQQVHWNAQSIALYSALVKEAISICKVGSSKRCSQCSCYNPKIRQDQSNKIFQTNLSKRLSRLNRIENLPNTFLPAIQIIEEKLLAEQQQQQKLQQQQQQQHNSNNNYSTSNENNVGGYDSDATDTAERGRDRVARTGMDLIDDEAIEDFVPTNKMTKNKKATRKKSRMSSMDGDDDDINDEDYIFEDDEDDDEYDDGKGKATNDDKKNDKFMHTAEVQAQLKLTYNKDPVLCNCLFGTISTTGTVADYYNPESYRLFFMSCVAVPPNRFRPPMVLGSIVAQHSQTEALATIIKLNASLQEQVTRNLEEQSYRVWIELQTAVNVFMDSSKHPNPYSKPPNGIRQLLEKKQGLFRMNMMGKRVNHCCRSVISPDPYVGTNEIGIPRHFAQTLTYPTPVTDWNITDLRQAVVRGTEIYPGARWVEMSTPSGVSKRIELGRMNRQQRESVAAKLLTHYKRSSSIGGSGNCNGVGGGKPTIVGRQLRDGDYVLMNRQPTLHKPGIMGHRVRVLHNPKQKTIRMHYANCNTYNADFDGDEMNCHYPQNDIARAEAEYIMDTNLQYIVPTDGTPLRGLIQDHVVGGVQLTKTDTFLEAWEYQQLLFSSLTSLQGLELIRSNQDIELMPPAIYKPRRLWTGKQVVSTLLLHLRKGNNHDTQKSSNLPGLTTTFKTKTPDVAFGSDRQENLVIIKDGELLRGVLDKNAFGSTDFSLIHSVYEAYGPEKAGLLLNAFGRLFTAYIQYYSGHSCRMEDLILTTAADQERRELVQRSYNLGAKAAKAWADSEGGKVPIPSVEDLPNASEALKPHESAAAAAKIGLLLSGSEGKENFANLDSFMQSQLNPLASTIVKACLPNGLAVPFPANTFSIMTTTGAKGSIVNQSQVSCALGQQALEGRRVPRMSSGRTLPSFQPYEPNPRADGFVMDRFLTGIRPQEYYFHCMAGREGLVDTAVKTSRSGYLQRCIIKHLEELKVSYDYSVRNAEGGIVQFLYGEDGLDPTKASYLDCSEKSFHFMAMNSRSLARINAPLPSSTIDIATHQAARSDEIEKLISSKSLQDMFREGDYVLARRLRQGNTWVRGALCVGWYPAIVTKVSSATVDIRYVADGTERKSVPVEVNVGNHCGARHTSALSSTTMLVKPAAPDPIIATPFRGHKLGSSGACVSERIARAASDVLSTRLMQDLLKMENLTEKDFSSLVGSKYSTALCAPGEAVGCIAGQSIGEPSTQMTLNTFHLAGAGANVTLGIPRLREIIQTASKNLKTPTMSVPIHSFVSGKHAMRLANQFQRLTLMELISGDSGIVVTEKLERDDTGQWLRAYHITLKLHPAERIRNAFGLVIEDIASVVAKDFVSCLTNIIKREIRRSAVEGDDSTTAQVFGGNATKIGSSRGKSGNDDDNDDALESADPKGDKGISAGDDEGVDDDDDDDDVGGEEDGMDAARQRDRKEGVSYDDDGEDAEGDNDSAGKLDDDDSLDDVEVEDSAAEKKLKLATLKQNTITLEPFRIDPAGRPLLMVGLVEAAAEKVLVRSRKNIKQAFLNEEISRGRCLQIAGINFEELWKLERVDHDKIMSNDTWAICCAYGVEAARNNIVKQIGDVFGAYGIEVNPRHLSLIADYMTFEGGYKALNRIGMEGSGSTLLQMSFETTANFMKKAAALAVTDDLQSPSANIVVGRPMRHGTGCFSVLAQY